MDNSTLVNALGEGESMSLFDLLTPHGHGLYEWIFVPAWDEENKLNLVFISYGDICIAHAATEDNLLLPLSIIPDCGDLDELSGGVIEDVFLAALGLDDFVGQLQIGITSRGGAALAIAEAAQRENRENEQEAAVH